MGVVRVVVGVVRVGVIEVGVEEGGEVGEAKEECEDGLEGEVVGVESCECCY